MANPDLIKTFYAEAAIAPYTLVKPGTADGNMVPAAAATDPIMGVSDTLGAAIGGRVDVLMDAIGDVKLGGTVARGDPLTSDASANAVKANPSAGSNNRIVGFAMIAGVSGDIIPFAINLGFMQG